MARARESWAADPIRTEYEQSQFPDERLVRRLVRIADAATEQPDASFPQMLGAESQAEGLYRFLNNDRVTLDRIIGGHVQATLSRAQQEKQCLIVHDTTDFSYSGNEIREGLGRTGSSNNGFLGHFSLAVTTDGLRVPLGILAVGTFARTGRKKPKATSQQRRHDPHRESLRWQQQVEQTEQLREKAFDAIHVMDREADIYDLVAWCCETETRFLIRAAQDRSVEDADFAKLSQVLANLRPAVQRTIELSARASGKTPVQRKRHPARRSRTASVAIAGARVELNRPRGQDGSPTTLAINVVRVWESQPDPGEPPVEWILLTREPIDTVAQLELLVDWYRARWTIEEYFKALKTGCAFEKRQSESFDSLTAALGIFVPIAWRLLLLKSLSRSCPDAPASVLLNDVQLQILAAKTKGADPCRMTVLQALLAIAKLGGHMRRNGLPGWQTLGAGHEKLRNLESGWRLATAAKDRRKCDLS